MALSLGHLGALLVTKDQALRSPALPVEPGLHRRRRRQLSRRDRLPLSQGRSIEDAFRLGLAAGSASLTMHGTELCHPADVERLCARGGDRAGVAARSYAGTSTLRGSAAAFRNRLRNRRLTARTAGARRCAGVRHGAGRHPTSRSTTFPSSPTPTVEYDGPAGGWGSLQGIARIFGKEWNTPTAIETLMRQNKPEGLHVRVLLLGQAGRSPHLRILRERRQGDALGADQPSAARRTSSPSTRVTELRGWTDYDLEQQGRLTHPLRYDRRHRPLRALRLGGGVSRRSAQQLRALDPKSTVFYASGRASLETVLSLRAVRAALRPQQPARQLQHVPRDHLGGAEEDDRRRRRHRGARGFRPMRRDLLLRPEHRLQQPALPASAAGGGASAACQIVTFNPVREQGLESFVNPQSPTEMLTGQRDADQQPVSPGQGRRRHRGADRHVQVRVRRDDAAQRATASAVLDVDFIAQHTDGLRGLRGQGARHAVGGDRARIRPRPRRDRGRGAGLCRGRARHRHLRHGADPARPRLRQRRDARQPAAAARQYRPRRAPASRPVRGHSNVQGQRTVGITEKPELVPLDRLAEQFGFEPPREKGMNTVEACEGMLDGKVQGLHRPRRQFHPRHSRARRDGGGVDADAAHRADRHQAQPQPSGQRRDRLSAAVPRPHRGGPPGQRPAGRDDGGHLQLHPRLARPAQRRPASICSPSSRSSPASPRRRCRPTRRCDWDDWVGDYGLVRDADRARPIRRCSTTSTRACSRPAASTRGNAARERIWKTESGKADFTPPSDADPRPASPTRRAATGCMTMRSNDQFNTTIYGYSDRLARHRGHPRRAADQSRRHRARRLAEGQMVCARRATPATASHREVGPLEGDAVSSCRTAASAALLSGDQSADAPGHPRRAVEDAGLQVGAGADPGVSLAAGMTKPVMALSFHRSAAVAPSRRSAARRRGPCNRLTRSLYCNDAGAAALQGSVASATMWRCDTADAVRADGPCKRQGPCPAVKL